MLHRLLCLSAIFAFVCSAQVAITITPAIATVPPGGTVHFIAAVTGNPNLGSTSVITPPGVGTLVTTIEGPIDSLAYTAPVGGSGVIIFTSTAHADKTAVATATITIAAPAPLTAVYQFTAAPYIGTPSSLGIWIQALSVPVAQTCSGGWVVAITNPNSYSGAYSTTNYGGQSSLTPSAFVPVTLAPQDVLAGPPQVTLLCGDSVSVSIAATPL